MPMRTGCLETAPVHDFLKILLCDVRFIVFCSLIFIVFICLFVHHLFLCVSLSLLVTVFF